MRSKATQLSVFKEPKVLNIERFEYDKKKPEMKRKTPTSKQKMPKRAKFDYTIDFDAIDFRKQPELYRVGKGEQGVLSVQPYKGEILPHWRFKNPEIAQKSADKIYEMFEEYKKQNDFVGADMARKFLMVG
jgi:hypothetical protein